MIRSLSLSLLAIIGLTFSACTSNEIEMGGVPKWMMNGAKLGDEPAPMAPDPELVSFRNESGPVELFMMTDIRNYPLAPEKKISKKKEIIDYERGRDYRIKRLFY